MSEPTTRKPEISRRTFLYAATATTAIGVAGWRAVRGADAGVGAPQDATAAPHHRHAAVEPGAFRYPEGDPTYGQLAGAQPRTVHKNASRMSPEEINRFSRAYQWAVAHGYFDVFNDEHFNAKRNRHHGADVLAVAPPAVFPGETPAWGFRLLPWHRSFILEAEAMLKAALAERNREERRDPAEADLLFLPYWDATHDRDLPGWVKPLRPEGGTAIVPEGLPPGHAGYGKPVGSRYPIKFDRWPRRWLVFDTLPPPDQIGRIQTKDDFEGLYQGIDLVPEVVAGQLPAAKQALAALAQKIPDNPDLQLIQAFLDPDYPKDAESQLAAFNAFLAIGHLANLEAAKSEPDRELIRLIKTLYSAFRFAPHSVLHFWAGGVNPRNPDARGTVTYFNELTVDPVFWMLHGELDRWWYTWETTHTGMPPVEGEDAVFEPLRPEEGRWYGGGRTYTLAELVDHQELAYTYDTLFTP
jgi:hypothetical protein